MPQIDFFSTTTVRLLLHCPGHQPQAATGFLYKRNEGCYLVSNWHVFSGRHPVTGQPRLSTGSLPKILQFTALSKMDLNQIIKVDVRLSTEDGTANWIQSRQHGQRIDVAAFRLDGEASSNLNFLEGDSRDEDYPILQVSQDLFIVGFPLGIAKQGPLPVWKRGTIASEPQLPLEDAANLFLVDSSTREGMSGSPVFFISAGGYSIRSGMHVMGGTARKLVGIYSGREGATEDETKAQLGRVWHLECLEHILAEPAPGGFV